MAGALDGVLVISLEQAVAAPMASRRLADAGARVIKLERPGGDFARAYDRVAHGQSSYFVWLNRGKQSVTIDLEQPDDRRLFEAMLAKADVFIQNLKPGAIARLGYPLEELAAKHPRLILCSISGYGETGPYADRKAYDLLIQAESGLASVTGGPESPSRVGVSVVDVATGMNAYEAILEALIARVANRTEVDAKVAACFRKLPLAELVAALTAADTAFGLVSDVAGLLKHPHLRRTRVGIPGGAVDLPAPAARIHAGEQTFGPVPAAGEHTGMIRAEFLS